MFINLLTRDSQGVEYLLTGLNIICVLLLIGLMKINNNFCIANMKIFQL